MTSPIERLLPPIAAVAAVGGLAAVSGPAAGVLVSRLAPVLLFVAAMSVVVNLSARAGVFEAVAAWVRTRRWPIVSPPTAAWCQIVALALVATVFLSLDTTAILVTPLAVALARRSGVSQWAVALAVIWIANVGSLLLPVSNLTNLLAAGSGVFDGPTAYLAAAWRPAAVAAAVAVAAAWLAYRYSHRGPRPVTAAATAGPPTAPTERVAPAESGSQHAHQRDEPDRQPPDSRLRAGLATLGVLLPVLASPFPYWASSTIAASVLVAVTVRSRVRVHLTSLIPWGSLSFVTVLSALAALAHHAGALDFAVAALESAQTQPGGLLAVAGAGAVLANLINNIPAFLALEAGAGSPAAMMALLVGVNAGPIITPWASLATLLWHDQLRRSGIAVSWRLFIVLGCVLAPLAVILPVLALGL